MELWDILDENGNKTGKTVERGKPMARDEFHLVVQIWIVNDDGEFLISKRSPGKPHSGMWESTGGSAVTGDDSLSAAMREVKEELGVTLDPDSGRLFDRYKREHFDCPDFADIWAFKHNADIKDIVLQPGETCDAMWASKEKIKQMVQDGEFIVWADEEAFPLDELFAFIEARI